MARAHELKSIRILASRHPSVGVRAVRIQRAYLVTVHSYFRNGPGLGFGVPAKLRTKRGGNPQMAQLNIRTVQGFFVAAGLLMGSLGTARPAIAAVPTAQPPYSLSVFAKSANGYSQPDSIVQWRDSIFV